MSLFARIDVNLPKDKKVRRVGLMGELLYIRLILVAKELMSDGEIDETQLELASIGFGGNVRKIVGQLVDAELLERTDGGWRIPPDKWAKWQETKAQIQQRQAKQRKRFREWYSKHHANESDNGPSNDQPNGASNALANGPPNALITTPDPDPDPDSDPEERSSSSRRAAGDERDPPPVVPIRDPVFEAIAEAFGYDLGELTPATGAMIGKVRSEIAKATPGVTPAEVHRRARNLAEHWPNVQQTPTSLMKHWAKCGKPPRPRGSDPPRPKSFVDRLLSGEESLDG